MPRPRRVLFAIIPEKGHIHPYLGPAAELVARGHEVAFYAAHDVANTLARAGFTRFYAGGPAAPPDANRGAAFAARVRDRAWLRGWIKSLLVDAVPAQIDPLRRAVDDFAPDVIAADPMVYQAPIVAAETGVPWAGLSSSLNPVVPPDFESELIATTRWLAPSRDALFTARGLAPPEFRVCDALAPRLNVVFATEALVGPAPAGVTLAGPSRPRGPRGDEPLLPNGAPPDNARREFPWDRLRDDLPLVYMSLGSQIYHQPRMYQTVLAATATREVQLVVSAGDLARDDALFARDQRAVAVPYAPQLALLARARAVITHGGANSVMEALDAAVPLLVSPICNDQLHNARFVAQSGAGLALDLDTATVAQVGDALDALLADNGPPRAAAARVAAEYRARDGAERAAAALLALVQ